jgi:hypothetical protein
MNLMKIGRILLITTLLGLIIPAASAQTVEIADASVDTGATTTIAIMAYNVTDLANFNITVTYDPAVVNVIAADNNAAFGVAINNLENVATGSVRLASLNSSDGQTGCVLLSTLTLEAVCTAGETALSLTINELMDLNEEAIAATLNSGSVTVVGEIVETRAAEPTGTITVSSLPSNATVYIDDAYEGTTPVTILSVKVGSHTIKLEKYGYEAITRTVTVRAGETANTSETLTHLAQETGSISISSSPSGAAIYLNGIYKGTTPKTISSVEVGSHTIKLEKYGYEAVTRTVTVRAGETANTSETLTHLAQETGSISISSSPSGADIYLNGVYNGTTPATITGVPPGAHTLKLEKYGYVEWLTSVHIKPGVTESITAHMTTTDVSPPAIRIDKPATIDQNNNGLLEEGEKVTITYGANDPSGVASVKLLLDGITLESQNQAGTHTVTTSPLTVGMHTIRVEATDSKSNSGFEELVITVERTGPSVYFGTTRTTTVQLILKPPSGVSVTSSSFAKAGSGIYTCTQTIEPGDNVRSIEVHLTGNQIKTHEIASEVYYQFTGSPKSPTRYETLTLIVKPEPHVTTFDTGEPESMVPGFGVWAVVAGLLFVMHLRRKRE